MRACVWVWVGRCVHVCFLYIFKAVDFSFHLYIFKAVDFSFHLYIFKAVDLILVFTGYF